MKNNINIQTITLTAFLLMSASFACAMNSQKECMTRLADIQAQIKSCKEESEKISEQKAFAYSYESKLNAIIKRVNKKKIDPRNRLLEKFFRKSLNDNFDNNKEKIITLNAQSKTNTQTQKELDIDWRFT